MSGLKTGVEDFISWSETGSEFREPGGTRYQESPGVPLPPGVACQRLFPLVHRFRTL